MGRPRIFKTKTEFAAAVDAYFDSITYQEKVTYRALATDEAGRIMRDDKGHDLYIDQPVINALGEPIMRQVYAVPPTILGLCAHLGIGHDSWSNYGKRKGFSEIVTRARARIEQFLEEGLYENPRSTRGIMLNLTSNYGWSNKQTVEMGEETRQVMRGPKLSFSDKEQLILAMGRQVHSLLEEETPPEGPDHGSDNREQAATLVAEGGEENGQ